MSEARRKNGMKKWLALALNVFFSSVLISCGGGGGSSSGDSYSPTPNTYIYSAPSSQTNSSIAVVSAPSGSAFSTSISISGSSANLPLISVTVCEPGNASRCNTINNVLLDTGSYGLRLFSSLLSLNLPQNSVAGKPLYEKTDFLSGSVWGSVVNADVYLADQKAPNIQIQLMQSTYPQSMTSSTANFYTTPNALGANGILGVGALLQDCGASCAYSAFNSPYYTYDSASGTVTQTALPISQQIPNPVAKLSNAAYTGGIQIDLTPSARTTIIGGVSAAAGFVLGVPPTALPNRTVKLALNSSAHFYTGYTAQTVGSSQRTLTSFIDSGSICLLVNRHHPIFKYKSPISSKAFAPSRNWRTSRLGPLLCSLERMVPASRMSPTQFAGRSASSRRSTCAARRAKTSSLPEPTPKRVWGALRFRSSSTTAISEYRSNTRMS